MDHPGFADKKYRERRKMIADIAFDYKKYIWPTYNTFFAHFFALMREFNFELPSGDPIPRVTYLENEIATWGHVYSKVESLLPTHACKQFIDAINLLKREIGYGPQAIPQLEDVSNFLKRMNFEFWKLNFRLIF